MGAANYRWLVPGNTTLNSGRPGTGQVTFDDP
jgi:hypothetical protein